jgi:4-amino-4-deoxy-L-arabinose transferase-like glycosyltransferase
MLAAFLLTGTHVIMQGDTSSYIEPGQNLIHHHAYSQTRGSELVPELDRTPGYPLFLILTGAVSGNTLYAVFAQILISLLSLVLVFRIGAKVFPERDAGVAAAWLFAIEPISVLYTVRLMPETLFVLLLLLTLDRLLSFYKTSRLTTIVEAGLALAAATYVRPVSYYLVVPIAVGLMFVSPRGLRWKAPVLLLITVIPLLALWQVRNFLETGYSGFSSIVEQNLYYYQSAEITAQLEHISLGDEQSRLGYTDEASYVAVHPEQRVWSEALRLKYMRAQSVAILSQHRGMYLKSHFRGVGVVAFTPCATELLQLLNLYPKRAEMPRSILNEGISKSIYLVIREHPGTSACMSILELALLLFYVLAVGGLFNQRSNSAALSTLVGVALYFLLIAGGAQAIGRYRSPVMPLICVIAGGAVVAFLRKKGEVSKTPPVPALLQSI